jgi:ferritin
MLINKIIQYINEKEIPEIVKTIAANGKNIESVIQQIKESRIEYQGKSQLLQWELEKLLERVDDI